MITVAAITAVAATSAETTRIMTCATSQSILPAYLNSKFKKIFNCKGKARLCSVIFVGWNSLLVGLCRQSRV